jgi:predicted nucleic acid-binding protein
MIFVDSGAWFASFVEGDEHYQVASEWFDNNIQPLLTTDYIVDETLTLLRARRQSAVALKLGEQFFKGALAQVYYVTEADLLTAWDIYRHFSDKEWSFTDCTSKVVIEKLGITRAFAFDHHFQQFGSVIMVP